MDRKEKCLVLFSGGQDSTVCLAWALERFAEVETIGFDYGQRHAVELTCRQEILTAIRRGFADWNNRLRDDTVLDLRVINSISDTALTREVGISLAASGLPNTFVPGRNLLFITFAAAVAYRKAIRHMVGGMCETDYSGYPDCRDDTLKALQVALGLGMDKRFVIHTPLMWLDKAATWSLAESLGGRKLVEIVINHTHTCYMGDRSARHAWGFGCGDCPACQLRARGYDEFSKGHEQK